MKEEIVWRGRPSQWTNAPHLVGQTFVGGVIVALAGATTPYLLWGLLLPGVSAGKRVLTTHFTRYELTRERLLKSFGVLSKRHDELELYRVRDYRVEQPFLLRLLGLGHVSLVTADKLERYLRLEAIPDAPGVKDRMRILVEERRLRTGTRDLEVG